MFGPENTVPKPSFIWDWKSDYLALTGQPLPAPPWDINPDGTIVGVPPLNAIGWTTVRTYKGAPTAGTFEEGGRPVDALASHYFSADVRFDLVGIGLSFLPPASYLPWGWGLCVAIPCDPEFIDVPWLVVSDLLGSPHVVAVGSQGTRDVTRAITAPARDLIALGLSRVPASEPEYRLAQAELTRRELVVDLTDLAVVGTLGVEGDQLTGARVGGTPRVPLGTEDADVVFAAAMATGDVGATSDTALAYSATRDELFALVRAPGDVTRLGAWHAGVQLWRDVGLEGEAIGKPLALAYHQEETALFALDEKKHKVRLLRIDLLTHAVSVLAKHVFAGKPEHVALTIGYDRELLIAGSRKSPKKTAMAHLRVSGTEVELLDALVLPGQLLNGPIREIETGVGYAIAAPGGLVSPRFVSRSAFQPAGNWNPNSPVLQ